MEKPSHEAIVAAAKWWAQQLAAPKFDNLGTTRGRDAEETRVNDFASAMGTWFYGGVVTAACGYGAERRQIYPELTA